MKTKFFNIKCLLLLLVLVCSGNGRAEVLGTAIAAGGKITASAIIGETVDSLIESARKEATRLLAESENTGNVFLSRAADELNLAADNVARMFAKQLKIAFEEIDEDKRDLLIGLASATKAATNLGDVAYTFKDTLSLDMRSILGEIPFVKESLVLQRISGLSVIAGKPKYTIRIIGSYVGLPGEDHRTSLSIALDGKEIEGIEIDPKEIHMSEVSIPATSFESYLLSDTAARIPLTVQINQVFKKRFLGFLWNYDQEKSYKAKVTLTIFPNYAGDVKIVARYQVLGWKKIEPKEREMTHSDHCSKHCKKHHGTSHSVSISATGNSSNPKIGDTRITSAACRQVSGTSGYSVDEGTWVSKDRSRATCQIRFRTQPQTFRLTAQLEEYGVIKEKDETIDGKLYFDQLTEVRIPKTSGVVFVKGKLITGDKVDMLASQVSSDSVVEVVRRLNNTNDKSIFLRAVRPPES